MIYHGYLDDSGDGKNVSVAGAIIGKKDDWRALGSRWGKCLQKHGIKYFKSSHCENLHEEFFKFRKFGMEEGRRKAAQVRDELDTVIKTSPVMALGVTLSLSFHATLLSDPERFGHVPDVPYRLAFQQVIAECGKAMRLLGRGNIVTFGHDEGDDFDALRKVYRDFKQKNKRYVGVLHDFVPLNDETHFEVQAADVAAYVTFKFAQNYMADPTAENMKRIRGNMYKIVNWLNQPHSHIGGFDNETAPAKAVYVT